MAIRHPTIPPTGGFAIIPAKASPASVGGELEAIGSVAPEQPVDVDEGMAGVAALPGGPTGFVDPIYAAIERRRLAYAAFLALCNREEDLAEAGVELTPAPGEDFRTAEMVAAVTESIDARRALAETMPTTPQGLVDLLAYVRAESEDSPLFVGDEVLAHAAAIEAAVRAMARELRPVPRSTATVDPVYEAVARYRSLRVTYLTEEESKGLNAAMNAAESELARVIPTTPAGLGVLVSLLREEHQERGPDGIWDHEDAMINWRRLERAVWRMAAARVQAGCRPGTARRSYPTP